MSDENVKDAVAPEIDYDAIASRTAEKLKESFQAAPQVRHEPPPPQGATDPLADLVSPYVKPQVDAAVRQARLAELAGIDAATFYADHPELTKEDRQEIEKRFSGLRANGVPFQREDILKHYRGENIDKEVDRRIKAREEAVTRAANAVTVGPGSPDKSPITRDARAMPTDELEKALDGVSF